MDDLDIEDEEDEVDAKPKANQHRVESVHWFNNVLKRTLQEHIASEEFKKHQFDVFAKKMANISSDHYKVELKAIDWGKNMFELTEGIAHVPGEVVDSKRPNDMIFDFAVRYAGPSPAVFTLNVTALVSTPLLGRGELSSVPLALALKMRINFGSEINSTALLGFLAYPTTKFQVESLLGTSKLRNIPQLTTFILSKVETGFAKQTVLSVGGGILVDLPIKGGRKMSVRLKRQQDKAKAAAEGEAEATKAFAPPQQQQEQLQQLPQEQQPQPNDEKQQAEPVEGQPKAAPPPLPNKTKPQLPAKPAITRPFSAELAAETLPSYKAARGTDMERITPLDKRLSNTAESLSNTLSEVVTDTNTLFDGATKLIQKMTPQRMTKKPPSLPSSPPKSSGFDFSDAKSDSTNELNDDELMDLLEIDKSKPQQDVWNDMIRASSLLDLERTKQKQTQEQPDLASSPPSTQLQLITQSSDSSISPSITPGSSPSKTAPPLPPKHR